jgi:hypothetical protein
MSPPVREPVDDNGPLKDEPLKKGESPQEGGSEDAPLKEALLKDAVPKEAAARQAPRRGRRSDQNLSLNNTSKNLNNISRRADIAQSRAVPEPPEAPEPPWRRKSQQGMFAGDVAVVELRSRLALAPDRIPEPPPPASTARVFAVLGQLTGIILVAAAVAGVVGYLWGSAPSGKLPQLALTSNQTDSPSRRPALASNHSASSYDSTPPVARLAGTAPIPASADTHSVANEVISVAPVQRAVSPAQDSPVAIPSAPRALAYAPADATPKTFAPPLSGKDSRDPLSVRTVPRLLTVNAVRSQQVDEPAPLAIAATDAGANVAVVIGGLAPGSALSAGAPAGPSAWRLATEDFNKAAVTPPRGFVGVMELTVELRLADNTVVDRRSLQLEWSGQTVFKPSKPVTPQGADNAAEIALMMRNGTQLMGNGDIAAARMMFQRAAEAGEAAAAFALAETYDPLVLRKLGARGGITSDIALAQIWYEKARDLGSTAAPERLERLVRVPE